MNHLHLIRLSFLLSILFSLAACEPDESAAPPEIEPGPVVSMTSFPLDVGNKWVYKMSVDVSGGETSHTDYVVDFEVISDTTINGMSCKKVRSTETEGVAAGDDRLGYRYLTQAYSGLDLVAINGPGTQVFFKISEELEIPNYSLVAFGQSGIEEVIVPDSALHYLKFPANDGEIWRSNEFGATSGAEFKRQWSGYYTVNTSAGSFDCIRLDLFGDFDQNNLPDSNSLFIQQYISPEFGLIKEVDVRELHWGSGETGDYLRDLTLISVDVQ